MDGDFLLWLGADTVAYVWRPAFSVQMFKRYIYTLIHVFVFISNSFKVKRLWGKIVGNELFQFLRVIRNLFWRGWLQMLIFFTANQINVSPLPPFPSQLSIFVDYYLASLHLAVWLGFFFLNFVSVQKKLKWFALLYPQRV